MTHRTGIPGQHVQYPGSQLPGLLDGFVPAPDRTRRPTARSRHANPGRADRNA
ncbi:hypothetical protein ACIG5E_39110 [Kitasatospora sp. NPDC053057]|uniref:hypothetical protein n=1 Tax=Kitasatospora sp. NPDC053057 TaxID=3364062 RepID=UPI0037C5E512